MSTDRGLCRVLRLQVRNILLTALNPKPLKRPGADGVAKGRSVLFSGFVSVKEIDLRSS